MKKKKLLTIFGFSLLSIFFLVGLFYLFFHQRINTSIHFFRHREKFKELVKMGRDEFEYEYVPYYYKVTVDDNKSVYFTVFKFDRSVDEFNSWNLIYIESDDPLDVPMCSFDGHSHKLEDNWYICQSEWN